MGRSVHIIVSEDQAKQLALAKERGVRSISWLVGRLVRQWLDDPHRKLPAMQLATAPAELTEQQRETARRREKLLKRWHAALVAGERRGESKARTTDRFLASLSESQRVSRGTLYNWARRYQGHRLVGLADRRSSREVKS